MQIYRIFIPENKNKIVKVGCGKRTSEFECSHYENNFKKNTYHLVRVEELLR